MTDALKVNRSERDMLVAVADREVHFTGMLTGGRYRRATAERLAERGLLERMMLTVCDGDGFAVEPERERQGYRLTGDGVRAFKRAAPEHYGWTVNARGLDPDKRARWVAAAGEPEVEREPAQEGGEQ